MRLYFSPLILFMSFLACSDSSVEQDNLIQDINPVDKLMTNVTTSHGVLDDYQFVFRDVVYTFKFEENQFEYTKLVVKDSLEVKDVLNNEGFTRIENGKQLDLSERDQNRYSESLNSVVYFVCLPLKLYDPAVNKQYMGITEINGISYEGLKVTFDQESGGNDYDDVFYYWFNKDNYQMEFFAYQYNSGDGGVRFRSAYNSRMVDGMRFQDYINYGAPIGTPLDSLPMLFELGVLEEVSIIETEKVIKLK